jgi:hypothetical protein
VATENTVDSNASDLDGGGINAQITSDRTVDASQASLVTELPVNGVAEDVSLILRGNTIRSNSASGGGAGAFLLSIADADPDNTGPGDCQAALIESAVAEIDFENNLVEGNTSDDVFPVPGCSDNVCENTICAADPFCCDVGWDSFCADDAIADTTCAANCGTSNCCDPVVVAGSVLSRMQAKGDAFSGVTIETSTIAANAAEVFASGLNAGVDAASGTLPDCQGTLTGRASLLIDRSIIGDNDAFGVGGPLPGDDMLTPTVTKSFVYDNGPGNGTDFQFESTLFPGGVAPPGNPLDDPLLDLVTFLPDLCSPAFDVGICSNDPDTVCTLDSECAAPVAPDGGEEAAAGGVIECVAEGAGHVANPDINDDGAIDGVDLMRLSVAFGAEDGVEPRYNPDADLNRNGMVEGLDLLWIAPLFGQECTP